MTFNTRLFPTALLTATLSFLLAFSASAQEKYTLSGYVKDAANGESVFMANVVIKDQYKGTVTNEYGFYSLTLEEGTYIIVFSYLGYTNQQFEVNLTEDTRLNVELRTDSELIDEVTITGERSDANVESTDMGRVEMSTDQIKALPALLGEVDIMRTLQLMPGIQSAGEGNSGFYVRGGGPDQNLILLDNAVVYNTGHLFGFFSVFNADAIKNTTLIKGGMPANYGGRLSSVVDMSMKEGNMKKWQLEGGIGAISSRLTLQGPIKKDKASFLISGRRTYIDVLTKPFTNGTDFEGNAYFFYDLNAKLNYKFSDKDRLYASGYFGRDVFKFSSPDGGFNFSFPWGNSTATLRWNHLFNDNLFMNAMFIYNDYQFEVSSAFQDVEFALSSGVRDLGGKVDFNFYPALGHDVKFGASHTYHTFTPYQASGRAGDVEFENSSVSEKHAHEAAIYALDDFSVTNWWKINVGLRGSMFAHVGPLDKIVFDDQGRAVDTLNYGPGENIKTYWGLEPRLSMRFRIDDQQSIKLGVTYNKQYIHLVSNSGSTLPTDLWVPSTEKVKPQIGLQYSLGYFRNFKEDMYETSIEVYYKDLENQIEYGESSALSLDADVEDSFVFGDGWSYGAEFFVKKAKGDFTGWIGYTLSWTKREFPDVNDGNVFPSKYDRRHDLSVVGMWDVNDKLRLSGTFVYGTGNATTIPVSYYVIDGQLVNEYGERNGYRLAPYHRLDFGATFILKDNEKRYSDLTLSVYNVYNRKNPFFIYYDVDGELDQGNIDVRAKQVSLFPVLPSLSWNFKF